MKQRLAECAHPEEGYLPEHGIAFSEACRVWTRVAMLSFGGPAGQIAVMHRILIDEKKWIGEERFLHALNFCMLLPGPEAQQLAIYIGWLLHRAKGGIVAGVLFVLPGLVAIMALSWIYVLFGNVAPVAALFFGLKAAVVAIVFQAVMRIGSRALTNRVKVALAGLAFAAIFLFHVPFPIVVLAAGLIGWLAGRSGIASFAGAGHGATKPGTLRDEDSRLGAAIPAHSRTDVKQSARIGGVILTLWAAPTLLLALLAPHVGAFAQIAGFFSKMALLTFGGAYAVLAWVGQAAVEHYHWLSPTEMLDGLGLAESTPGPLIMVTQYVGFIAAFRHPGGLPPLLAATLGGLLTTWVTFVPCFLWVLTGAPYVERLRSDRALSAALSAITAAVVGVILNLALWFALHFWFSRLGEWRAGLLHVAWPDWNSLDFFALALSVFALLAVWRLRAGTLVILGGCAAAGLIRSVIA